MGSFSQSCKLTGVPITAGMQACIIPIIMRNELYDNSEAHIRKFGKSYMCSNDGPRLKFIPIMFPIFGTYDDYGGLEDIIEDDNTKVIEVYYNLPIQDIVNIICSFRKDDGYDANLDVIKTDPDNDDDDNDERYQARYMDLIKMSAMWVHATVFNELTNNIVEDNDSINMGIPLILKSLGFTQIENAGSDRYNLQFKKDNLIINSDGTWLKDGGYYFTSLKEYCANNGVDLDISNHENKDKVELIFDYIIPYYDIINTKVYDELLNKLSAENLIDLEKLKDFKFSTPSFDGMQQYLIYLFLNGTHNDCYSLKNPLTVHYYASAKEGKLKDNIVRFWRFDTYMYACSRFYDIIGTGPQYGDYRAVLKVLESAISVVKDRIKEYDEYNEDDE